MNSTRDDFYQNRIYPRLVRWLGNPGPILDLRRQMVPLAHGTVLEIGVGSGVNFAHYDVARVTLLYALEPNPGMLRLAEMERRRRKLNVQFLDSPGERIPLDDGSVDTVLSTFTLCTIPDVVEAIRSIGRGSCLKTAAALSPTYYKEGWPGVAMLFRKKSRTATLKPIPD